ncbi:hypothetical protein JTY75_15500, partial [Citrobacter freundii]|uniref:hypothetical protein n=1 Tax=Citrobacter freundii TaxID=546 RepID=UPI0019579251
LVLILEFACFRKAKVVGSTPIIAPFQTLPKSTEINLKPVYCGFWPVFYLLLSTGLNRNQFSFCLRSSSSLAKVEIYSGRLVNKSWVPIGHLYLLNIILSNKIAYLLYIPWVEIFERLKFITLENDE